MAQNFGSWMQEVNKLCIGKFGRGIDDLPSMSYWDWYNYGITVEEAISFIEDDLVRFSHTNGGK